MKQRWKCEKELRKAQSVTPQGVKYHSGRRCGVSNGSGLWRGARRVVLPCGDVNTSKVQGPQKIFSLRQTRSTNGSQLLDVGRMWRASRVQKRRATRAEPSGSPLSIDPRVRLALSTFNQSLTQFIHNVMEADAPGRFCSA